MMQLHRYQTFFHLHNFGGRREWVKGIVHMGMGLRIIDTGKEALASRRGRCSMLHLAID
jgi:hypothetical protein